METIGVRELKARASEIVTAVQTEGKRYQVTRRGKPVAMIVPTRSSALDVDDADGIDPDERVWADIDDLAREIGKRWPRGVSAVEALSAGRR